MRTSGINRAMGIIEVKVPDLADPSNFDHCGMAILVSPRAALTCAHVVNAAIPRKPDADDQPAPDIRITLFFPMVPGGQIRLARVVRWRKMGHSPLDDIAVLELDEPAPPAAGVTVLASISEQAQSGRLSLFGVRSGYVVGEHVEAKFLGQSTAAWRQITVAQGQALEPGFSGTGIWDEAHQATIGMAVRRQGAGGVAYFLPAEALIEFAGDIPHEERDLSSNFSRVFTIFATLFFVAVLFHFLADRIRQFPWFLTLGLGNEILAAFWGLHLIGFLMPVLLWYLLSFAEAYREHPWWMRVPQFGFFGAPPRPSPSRFATVATLILLVAIPLYLNGHFLRRLHSNEMKVYIEAKAQGYDPQQLAAAGESCGSGRAAGYCTHPKAGLYSLVPPGAPGKGGFLENYYQIGGLDRSVPGSVTFFPIVQPIVLWLLTGLCAGLSALLLRRIARPERRLVDTPASKVSCNSP